MRVQTEIRGGVTILRLTGTLMGGSEADVLRQAFYEAIREERNQIVLDLGDVHWMNSNGLGVLVAGLSTVRASGGEIVLARVPEKVLRPLQLTRLDGVFRIFCDVEEAVAELQKEGP